MSDHSDIVSFMIARALGADKENLTAHTHCVALTNKRNLTVSSLLEHKNNPSFNAVRSHRSDELACATFKSDTQSMFQL